MLRLQCANSVLLQVSWLVFVALYLTMHCAYSNTYIQDESPLHSIHKVFVVVYNAGMHNLFCEEAAVPAEQ